MRTLLLILLALSTGSQLLAAEYEADAFTGYITRYKDIAIKEMERTGIPASIKLAQGLLESDAGRSELAVKANNHFGIKCGNDWVGDTHYKEDDDYDDKGKLTQSCFRRYKTADASFVGHSEFLLDPRKTFRYGFLFRLDPTDYKEWARGLKQAGYATNPRYPQMLIDLIERYQLYRYDQESKIDLDRPEVIIREEIARDEEEVRPPTAPTRPTPVPTGIQKNNDVKYVAADGQLTLEEIARRVDVSVRTLIKYNEFTTDRPQLSPGDKVYLQPKRSSYRGKASYHQVRDGESMFAISQQYGVRLSKLYQRNRLEPGQEPAAGERIKLRGSKLDRAPRLRSRATPSQQPPVSTPSQPVKPATADEEPWRMDEDNPIAPEPVRPAPQGGQPRPDTVRPGAPVNPPVVSRPAANPPPVTNQPVFTEPAPKPQPAAQPAYHTVVKGDTLYNISRRYNVTVADLRRLNNLGDDTIRLGQQLRVQ